MLNALPALDLPLPSGFVADIVTTSTRTADGALWVTVEALTLDE